MSTARIVERELRLLGTKEKAKTFAWFFKTGKGQYGYGDVFVGVTVPEERMVAKKNCDLPLDEIEKLLLSRVHECRLTALLILVEQYARAGERARAGLVKFYLAHTKRINNWDLVDLSAPQILGDYLLTRDRNVLYKLVGSKSLWERRIAIVATFAFIRSGESPDTFALAKRLFSDSHDLIHKAVGWMLREVGKRVSREELTRFLKEYKTQMPRTTLRYAVEHYSSREREAFLAK